MTAKALIELVRTANLGSSHDLHCKLRELLRDTNIGIDCFLP